jgi:hypothetical protein
MTKTMGGIVGATAVENAKIPRPSRG